MKRTYYDEIISKDVPGQNADKSKAEVLRTFEIPERFVNDKSANPTKKRYVNVLAAMVSETEAVLVVDFSRLSRLHVISKDSAWEETDMDPSSPVRTLLAQFKQKKTN